MQTFPVLLRLARPQAIRPLTSSNRLLSTTARRYADPWLLPNTPEHLEKTTSPPDAPAPTPLARSGESVEQMCARVDDVIKTVRTYHTEYFHEGMNTRDVMIVAHGHFSRCLIARWLGMPLAFGTKLNVEPGGIAVLSYNHHRLEEVCCLILGTG